MGNQYQQRQSNMMMILAIMNANVLLGNKGNNRFSCNDILLRRSMGLFIFGCILIRKNSHIFICSIIKLGLINFQIED